MKKSIAFFCVAILPFLAGLYDLYVGGADGLLEATALFLIALVFTVLGSTFYLSHRLQAGVSKSHKDKILTKVS